MGCGDGGHWRGFWGVVCRPGGQEQRISLISLFPRVHVCISSVRLRNDRFRDTWGRGRDRVVFDNCFSVPKVSVLFSPTDSFEAFLVEESKNEK
jgi:hypothetical protein